MFLRTLRKVKAIPPPMIISFTWSNMLLISWILSLTLALYDQSNNQIKQSLFNEMLIFKCKSFWDETEKPPLRNCRKCPRTVYLWDISLRIVVHSSTTYQWVSCLTELCNWDKPEWWQMSDSQWICRGGCFQGKKLKTSYECKLCNSLYSDFCNSSALNLHKNTL